MKLKLHFNLAILVSLLILTSCLVTTENKDYKKRKNSEQEVEKVKVSPKKSGFVEYELRLEIPDDEDDNLFEDIIKGAVEGLVEHINPTFSVKFMKGKARVDFDKVEFMHNEFHFDDSVSQTFRIFDFEKMSMTEFEEYEDEGRVASTEKINTDKYDIVYVDQQKEILGFDCSKAWLIDPIDEDTITVWYAPKIKVPLSPFEYVPIDGLSLEMVVDGIRMRAVQVAFEDMDEELFEIPSDVKYRRIGNSEVRTEEI